MNNPRKIIIAGNWKMKGNKKIYSELISEWNQIKNIKYEVIIGVPYPYLDYVVQKLNSKIKVASQNIHHKEQGAYTGEVSVDMIKDFGVDWTILGHSERRFLYKETNEIVANKVKTALNNNINVILCIGERMEHRVDGMVMDVITKQLSSVFKLLNNDQFKNIVIAYEPVWAIGTGRTPTEEQIQKVHANIRTWIKQNVTEDISRQIRLLYGGSVSYLNSQKIAECKDVDGFLIGGTSLTNEFEKIIGQNFINI